MPLVQPMSSDTYKEVGADINHRIRTTTTSDALKSCPFPTLSVQGQ